LAHLKLTDLVISILPFSFVERDSFISLTTYSGPQSSIAVPKSLQKQHRFLNQDVYISTGEGIRGYNMFAYCLNNPVTRTDISGADSFSVTEGDDDNPMDDLGASNLGVGGGSGGGTVNGGGGGVSGGTGSTGNTVTANSNGGTLKGSSNVPAAQNSGWQVGGALPLSGVANTIMFLFSADGYLKQMRIIGPDGSKGYDIDFTHGGNHLFPHVHCWDFTQTPPSRN
jgi:hypothetical protein